MWIFIFIIALIFMFVYNNDYKKQIKQLKNKNKELETELMKYKNGINNTTIEENNTVVQNEINQNVASVITPENTYEKTETLNKEDVTTKIKPPKNTEGIKNKFILMLGATLIVLAAIVFLTSTWHTVPDIIKTAIILLLVGVFLGASKIAKDVFKLVETANTFLYIALAYLPIALFSIALFGLLGDYLSLYGDGRNIYFAICTIFLSILYFQIGARRNQKVLFNASMIMQFLSVVFITQILDGSFETFILGLILYNIIITLLKKGIFKEYQSIINIYNYVYLFGAFFVEIVLLFVSLNQSNIFANVLLIISFYLNYIDNKNYINISLFLTEILVLCTSILLYNKYVLEVGTIELIMFIIILGMYITAMFNKDYKWKESTIMVSTIAMVMFYISTLFIQSEILIVKSYIILWTISILNIISYILLDKWRVLLINFIPVSLFLAGINTMIVHELNPNFLVGLSIGACVFGMLNIIKSKKCSMIFQIYSHAMIAISLLICMADNINNFANNVIVFILLMILYFVLYIRNQNIKVYKIVSYLLLNAVLLSALNRFDLIKHAKYIPLLTTLIIMGIEYAWRSLQDNTSKIYLFVSFVLAFICLSIKINIATFLSVIVLGIVFEIYVSERQLDHRLNIIPFIALIPSVYFSSWAKVNDFNFMYLLSFILIIFTNLLSIRKKEINIYTFVAGIYVALQIITTDLSIYLNLSIGLISSILHWIEMPKDRVKFEVITYVLGLALYNTAIEDLSYMNKTIRSISILKYFGIIVFSLLITRNILKKYVKGDTYKVFEYIAFSAVYIDAISKYTSQEDGMIFMFMLVGIVVFSYIKKFGPVFFTTAIAIIVNGFYLTQEFWFSIPWWVYMLVIGSILLAFAVRNELSENKEKELIKSKVKTFKDYMDM